LSVRELRTLSARDADGRAAQPLPAVEPDRWVESRRFGDLDHLLVEGHEQLAHALLEPIAAEVAR
jgi:hypothetical protein